MLDRDKILWYPLRVSHSSASRLLKLQELLREEEFIEQTYVPMEYRTKDFKTQLVPVISNLIFVRATYNQLNVVRHSTNLYAPLRYMMRPVTEGQQRHSEILYVPDKMMDQFIRVTDGRHDDVIFLDNPDFAFKPGIKACITEGLYAGVVGEVKRIQKNLCLVVAIQGVAAAAILHVPRHHLCYLSDEDYSQLTL
jgi:transcription antitermination factor NusG